MVFEVQIDYPEDLHDKHNEFSILPEYICSPVGKTKKLTCNLIIKNGI